MKKERRDKCAKSREHEVQRQWEIHDAEWRSAGQARAGTYETGLARQAEGRPHGASWDHERVRFHHKNTGKPLDCDTMGL